MLKISTRALYETGWRKRQADARAKGEHGKYVGRGRFAEKGGGQQVGSAFQASSDNEKIKALYGNYGFWAWLRYWYLDSADFITMMLLDKGYYDYDFSEPKEKHNVPKHNRTHEQTQDLFSRMGFGKVKQLGTSMNAAELQAEAIFNEKLSQR